jgi:plastocyanin
MKRIKTLAVLAVIPLGACMSSNSSSPEPSDDQSASQVTIQGFRYDPNPLTVAAGTTIKWTNQDEILHTATAGTPDSPSADLFDGEMDGVGSSFETVIDDPGTYEYFCTRHNSMTATVIVE